MRIRTQVALAFTLMTATILLILSGSVYFLSRQHAREFFFTRLEVRASIAAEGYFDQEGSRVNEMRERHLQRLPGEQDYLFENNESFPDSAKTRIPDLPDEFIDELLEHGSAKAYRGFQQFVGRSHQANGESHFVIATAYDESGAYSVNYLKAMLVIGFCASITLVFLLGRALANRIMRPIAEIISKVHDITKTNLSDRLEVTRGKDEIAEMATTFNNMLDQLETTFELQRNFIGNASHELNTPLTAILGQSEVILQSRRTDSEYVQALTVIQHEARKLHNVTSSLLKLSSISYEGKKQRIELLHLDELLMEIKINFDRRVPDNKVKVLVQSNETNPNGFTLIGSEIWLELAITNVIQNSIKYSDNKEVLVTLSSDSTHALIEISDQGIGIPDDEIRFVFEPFFRARNTSSYKGYGIGLPLAERIARLHSGQLKILSKPNVGTKVTLRFPHPNLQKA